jgi:hypothetical protein
MTGFFENTSGGGGKKKKDPNRITLSEDEQEVLEHLKRFTWPKGSASQLPAAVRTSMRNYNKFLKQFKKVLKESIKEFPDGTVKRKGHLIYNDLHEFIQHRLASAFQPATTYMICWFESLHGKIAHWKNWPGKIRPFTIQSKEFQSEGYDLATDFGGNSAAKLWKEFMELMDEE